MQEKSRDTTHIKQGIYATASLVAANIEGIYLEAVLEYCYF
jgi:hypothetical protein